MLDELETVIKEVAVARKLMPEFSFEGGRKTPKNVNDWPLPVRYGAKMTLPNAKVFQHMNLVFHIKSSLHEDGKHGNFLLQHLSSDCPIQAHLLVH